MPYSSEKVAKKLGITAAALSKYIKAGKVPAPESITSGGMTLYLWTEPQVERVRKLLPKIKNGRKTRYQKQESGVRSQKSEKPKTKKQPQPPSAVPHRQRQKKH